MIRLPVAKSDPRCSCVTDQYECGFCRGRKLKRIWNGMTAQQRAYDEYVVPGISASFACDDGGERSCSCHVCAPCSWCMDQPDPDEPQEQST